MSTKAQVVVLLGALGFLALLAVIRFGGVDTVRDEAADAGSAALTSLPPGAATEDEGTDPLDERADAPVTELVEPAVPQGVVEVPVEQGQAPASSGERVLELELREARQVILRLEEEREKNLKERLALQEQVRRLTHSLAEEKAHADRLRVRVKSPESGMGSEAPALAGVLEHTIRVVEVDRDNRVAILDAGRANGVQPGMVFGVLRDGVPVSRLKATDVRNRVSAAAVEDVREGQFPQAGDRVVPWTGGVE